MDEPPTTACRPLAAIGWVSVNNPQSPSEDDCTLWWRRWRWCECDYMCEDSYRTSSSCHEKRGCEGRGERRSMRPLGT
jgi:hypothetical protein